MKQSRSYHKTKKNGNQQPSNIAQRSIKVSLAAVLSATAVALAYARPAMLNIEPISLIVFLSGVALGSRIGALVGMVSETVFSVLNPFGSGALWPPILLTQVGCMTLIGVVGGVVARFSDEHDTRLSLSLKMAAAGLYLTLIYDLITNFGYALSFPMGYDLVTSYGMILIAGSYFMVIHVFSNMVLFGTVGPVASRYIVSMINKEGVRR